MNTVSQYTALEIATLQAKLNRYLGPEYIDTRQGPGGCRLHYISTGNVVDIANQVFGFNGWSSSIKDVHIDYVCLIRSYIEING